ncbi:ChaN family lipoprotein [Bacteroides uniformis]|jgi:hypothetical protein|uniref:ChaN family lipoprotein n=1 Tax=Bacteroides uniformis TaxID=820 RepID=UPI001F01407C|nr:ChaN family lipoprotein [Bacteroides uniformis]
MIRKVFNCILFSLLFFLLPLSAQDKIQEVALAYLHDEAMSPDDYLVAKFRKADIVLLAEDHGVKENLDFVCNLIPKLYENNILLGMEFGAYEDQRRLDSLINAPKYDEQVARELMFNYNTRWAITEYMEIYRAAWKWNRSLPKDARKFRILNISYHYNWQKFSGVRTPENMHEVFPLGNTEDFRCGLLEREVLALGQKILVLTGTPHAFTFYHFPYYDYTSPGYVRYEQNFLGNLLYSKYGAKVVAIALHQPFPNRLNRQPALLSPALGRLEAIMGRMDNKPIGFDLKGTPLGKLDDDSYYSMGYNDFTLADLFDGYIFLKPISGLSSCSIDYKFMDDTNWNEAVSNNPDPDWHPRPQTREQYWEMIKDFVDIRRRYTDVQ